MRNQDKRTNSLSDMDERGIKGGVHAQPPLARDSRKRGDDHRGSQSCHTVENENVETLRAVLTWGSGLILGITIALSVLGL